LSNILRLHKPPGTRIRLLRVDAPRTAAPTRAADHCMLPGSPAGGPALMQDDGVTIPVDDSDIAVRLQRAYEQGRAEARAEAETELALRLDTARAEADERMGALMEGIAGQVRAFTAALERDAYTFAIAVAGRIVKHEIAIDREVVVRQVRESLRRIVGVESIKLRVHPEDEVLIRSHRTALLTSSDSVREVIIEPDPAIERGGCIIESSSGNVDARIATQLRQVENALCAEESIPQERMS
jgi:flagellar biosynthesis/type III secretory pathway protein FliH